MFKIFDPSRDIKTQVSSINEVLVFNGAIITGAVGDANIKKYSHWTSGSASGSLYQSIYNVNYTSSNAVELINITYGQTISSSFYTHLSATNKVEKNKVYRLHAKMLLGDEDTRFNISGSNKDELIFVHLKRSQVKDELKRGSTRITSVFSGSISAAGVQITNTSASFTDSEAEGRYSQTDRGDVGNLVSGSAVAGLIFYQAGVLVLVPEVFSCTSSISTNPGNFWSGTFDYGAMAVSGGNGTFENLLDSIRDRWINMTTINQTNLQSTYYFCRAQNDEFNYSSNPTFLDASQRIIPTSGSNNLQTRTYPTKILLLGENQEVLATACIGKPIKKSPDSEFSLKVRLDN
jgi:hypothetical protein